MHEANKPLSWFINTHNSMVVFINQYKKSKEDKYLKKLIDQAKTYGEQSKHLEELFKKLNPLASRSRKNPINSSVSQCIESTITIFKEIIKKNNIVIEKNISSKVNFFGWKQDLIIALTNLFENSIYWLEQNEKDNRRIKISSFKVKDIVVIELQDNGPGIKKEYIKSEVILSQEFRIKLKAVPDWDYPLQEKLY